MNTHVANKTRHLVLTNTLLILSGPRHRYVERSESCKKVGRLSYICAGREVGIDRLSGNFTVPWFVDWAFFRKSVQIQDIGGNITTAVRHPPGDWAVFRILGRMNNIYKIAR